MPFGASFQDVVNAMGDPDDVEALHDCESYPKGRRTLTYGDVSLTIGAEIGVFGMGVRRSSEPLLLWDQEINDLSAQAFAAFLLSRGARSETAPLTSYGATDVYSADYGIFAYFADDRISEIEITIPSSCPTER